MPALRYKEIAYFLKTFGIKGELKTVLLDDATIDFSSLDTIFIQSQGQYIPYFIEYVKDDDVDIILKLEDINNPEVATKLRGEKIFIQVKDEENASAQSSYDNLEGYQVYNEGVLIGKLKSIEAYPNQMMAIVLARDKEILIPLVESFVESIDENKRQINFQLPAGLLDL